MIETELRIFKSPRMRMMKDERANEHVGRRKINLPLQKPNFVIMTLFIKYLRIAFWICNIHHRSCVVDIGIRFTKMLLLRIQALKCKQSNIFLMFTL